MNKRTRNNLPAGPQAIDTAPRRPVGAPQAQPELLVRQQSVTVQVQLPPPEMLRQFDEARPGTSDLLIRWSEEEQAHRRRLDIMALDANAQAQSRQLDLAERQIGLQRDAVLYQAETVRASDLRGQLWGAAVCLVAICGAIYLALNGQQVVAGILAAIPTAAIIQSFRTLTRQEARDPKAPSAS